MRIIGSILLITSLLVGCDDDSDPALSLSFNNLETLGSGYVYEGWIIVGGSPVSTGRFTDPTAPTVDSSVSLDGAEAFVLSIEPEPDADPAPAPTKILGGAFTAGTSTLTIAHSAALNDDFSTAAGTSVLATPSTASTQDETSGIWFFNPPTPTDAASASLTLPTLPAGWEYEGWVVVAGTPLSTGRFTDAGMADSDGGGPDSGPLSTPGYPGQDFITTPLTDLAGGTAVISVEPEPDDSAAPFAFKPLTGTLTSDIAPTAQTLDNNVTASAPTGTATIE